MGLENELSLVTTLADSDVIRALKAGASKNINLENLKALIAAGDKLVSGYYYFQDAANPLANDWRINASDTIYMKFERYSGTEWSEQFSIGGSAETDSRFIIREDAIADIIVINEDGSIQNLIRKATWSAGTVVGDIDGIAYLGTSGEVKKVSPIEVMSWKIAQSDDTQESTGTSFYVDNTTLDTDGFIAEGIKISSPSIPIGIKAQLKIFRQSDLVNPIWLNVTDIELVNGAGEDIVADGSIQLSPRFFGFGSEDIRLVINTSESITLNGSTTDGTDIYFESYDSTVCFCGITDESNVVSQIAGKTDDKRLSYNALKDVLTESQIKTKYEANANTNAFTDSEKTTLGNQSGENSGDQDISGLALKSNVLELDNTAEFTPDADYEPSTKKYVDDNVGITKMTITPTANIENLDVSSLSPFGILFVDNAANRELRSLSGGTHGDMIQLVHISTKDLKIKDPNAGYTGQKIETPGSADRTLIDYGGCNLVYNSDKGLWFATGIYY